MSKSIYGYVRVSTKEQNLDRQLIAMREYGVPEKNIFIDKQSGKDFDRPAYQRMMKELSSGGVLVIKSIDRLGRSYDETIEEWRRITREKGIEIVVLDLPVMCSLPTGTLLGRLLADLILYLLSYFAQAEREMNHQRQAEGIQGAVPLPAAVPSAPTWEPWPLHWARWWRTCPHINGDGTTSGRRSPTRLLRDRPS